MLRMSVSKRSCQYATLIIPAVGNRGQTHGIPLEKLNFPMEILGHSFRELVLAAFAWDSLDF